MDRILKDLYEQMPWSEATTPNFTKPSYTDIVNLKKQPIDKREMLYAEYYELQTFLDIISGNPEGKLLDLGAGVGNLSYLFHNLKYEVTACDINKENFKPHDIHFVESDLNDDLPFSNTYFDYIISKQTIEHLTNPYHFINEISRVLKNNGVLLISTPNTSSLRSRWTMLRQGLPYGFSDTQWNYGGHMTPIFYSQIEAFLRAANITNVDFYTNRYSLYSLNRIHGKRKRFIGPLLKLVSKNNIPETCLFGDKLIVKGKKVNH